MSDDPGTQQEEDSSSYDEEADLAAVYGPTTSDEEDAEGWVAELFTESSKK